MGQKILIVDDDEPTRLGLAALLADAGYETVTASTVPTAVQALANEQPDLLIVDIRLHEYNGLQLIAMGPERIPAIVVTGFADPVLEADARRLGADYLLKPISAAALRGLIARRLSKAAGADGFAPARRWSRKGVVGHVPVRIEHTPARLLDIGYGGVRLEVPRSIGAELPRAFTLTFPATGVSVPLDLVWERAANDTTWMCGAAIGEPVEPQWRALVDTL